ncbi:MAG: site-2 protease family protein, partial [Arenimonas sp.]
MTQIFALIGAIVLITYVLQLRALLAFPFPRKRHARSEDTPDEATDPLFVELQAQAAALGFGEATWLRVERVDGIADSWPVFAVHRAPDGLGALWVATGSSLDAPHRLLTWHSHRLADGRTAITQPFDAYFELVQGPHLVARMTSLPGLEGQWLAHSAWVEGLGSAPVAIAEDELAADTATFHEQIRGDLIASGALKVLDDNLAVPRLRFAWRMRRAMKSAPKSPPDARPVPPDRLARFAAMVEAISHRSPPRSVQWALFAVSVALFMGLGVLLWDAAMAVYVGVVVLVHEVGHFLAMRAFGYRNTHILALPLVGGVAMGHDVDPSAAKRAWMSLMGPLPGIVIGWGLLVAYATGPLAQPWVLSLAGVFLFVNYLNVLPMPPLDGAHVLEALLPARWARLQTVVIGVLAIIGGLVAAFFGLYLLTFLALLQLPGLVTRWKLHGVEASLVAQASIALGPRDEKLQRIARALDDKLGPTANATTRVQQVLQVLHRIDLKPMSWAARVPTALVYAALLVVPVGGAVIFGVAGSSLGTWEEPTAEDATHMADMQAESAAREKEAAGMPLPKLLAGLSSQPLPPPATPGAVAAAEARLGKPLPDDLRALYA